MAKPNPERELERLRKALGKSGPPQVVAITGTSDYFRGEALEAVVAAIDERAELRRIDGPDDTDGRELDDLRGAVLFGPGCWLVVRRAAPWLKSHGSRLEEALGSFAQGCGLVFETPKLDRRTKLAKSIAEVGEAFEFRDLYAEPYDRSRSPLEAELVSWVVTRARKSKLTLTPEAAFLIVSMVGQAPGEILAELERLAPLLQGKTVDPGELRKHLSCSFESTPFEFAEAFLLRNRRRAMRSLDAMFARGVKSKDGSTMDRGGLFPFITTWLHQSLTSVFEGRRLMEAGVPARDVPGRVGVRVFVERYEAQLNRCSMRWVRRALHELHACQRDLRTTGEDPELLLGRLVARCLGGQSKEGAA